ncbi:hypothetical protein XELAEV_18015509mg [Xenopus laevis]|uniref:CREG-like beta-barrel domain-containing protein n=1 Tax=Xenopus laevis TaxID=8355 RepID=A0A974DI53_XENLA|nr:hypothetical protein XELAEV_18015509mg [Xenopus laevis]
MSVCFFPSRTALACLLWKMHCQLEDTISIWKQSYPASTFKEEDREMKPRPASVGSKQISSPSRMFSYKRETERPALSLIKNPVASLTFADLDADLCKIIDEEDDSQTASLTLTGQMVIVPPEEADFAKKALFSRKLSPNSGWLLMKMKTDHIHVTDCYGKAFTIKMEDYYRAKSV